MNVRDKLPVKSLQFLALGLGTALLTVSCSIAFQESSSIKIDGSSTVYPITKEIIGKYQASQEAPVEISLEFSGTGGGFDKFCRGETDISNASRPIQLDEMAACDRAEVGTVFEGKSQFNLTISELLKKQPQFQTVSK